MALPQVQGSDKNVQLLQSSWASQLDPMLANPSLKSLLLKDITLTIGSNTINHLLGRKQQGWRIVDINGGASIYRSQPFNHLTLTLNSDAVVTITLEVF